MAAPATTGQLRTTIPSCEIGDYFKSAVYLASRGTPVSINTTVGYFGNQGELAYVGTDSYVGWKGFYFIKVAKGLFIADRILQPYIPWDTLNTNKLVQGKAQTFTWTGGSTSGKLRLLTGGNAYRLADGGRIIVATNAIGGYPANNEWDTYIVNSNLAGKCVPGDDAVWHWSVGIANWMQDTPAIDITTASHRIIRGYSATDVTNMGSGVSSYSGVDYGFRPAFEFIE